MSANNGIIRIGRKGLKKFAFGEDGPPFEVDVVMAFQQWIGVDESFRPEEEGPNGTRSIPVDRIPEYHKKAVEFAALWASNYQGCDKVPDITTAEALDFIARLREQYDELADFFQPKLREKPASHDTSETELLFSTEP